MPISDERLTLHIEGIRESIERINATLENFESVNRIPHLIDAWYFGLLHSLAKHISRNGEDSITACQARKASLVCFHSRNLLELQVWSSFCTASEQNAQRFREDALRDMEDLQVSQNRLQDYQPFTPQTAEQFENLNQQIRQAAAQIGMPELNGQYMRVSDVARQLGQRHFDVFNKVCSKFAHTTAALIFNPVEDDRLEQFCRGIFVTGAFLAMSAHYDIGNFIWRKEHPGQAG